MWKNRNEEELKNIRQRKKNAYKDIWRPCILAVIIFIVSAIQAKIGFSKYRIPSISPITWEDFFKEGLLTVFWLGLIAFFVIYAGQIILKRRIFSGTEAMICLKCEKLKNDDKIYQCDCGGAFVPLDELEWIEDKSSSQNAD